MTHYKFLQTMLPRYKAMAVRYYIFNRYYNEDNDSRDMATSTKYLSMMCALEDLAVELYPYKKTVTSNACTDIRLEVQGTPYLSDIDDFSLIARRV